MPDVVLAICIEERASCGSTGVLASNYETAYPSARSGIGKIVCCLANSFELALVPHTATLFTGNIFSGTRCIGVLGIHGVAACLTT